ncbi:Uncharacterized protein HZ326_1538 [Fusarium oxysporum f. sp. albedinis]|nr:Uncharacterized protein HZ326_1538 [Fusarium oxysporum f. sp. albedinis]
MSGNLKLAYENYVSRANIDVGGELATPKLERAVLGKTEREIWTLMVTYSLCNYQHLMACDVQSNKSGNKRKI